MTLLYLVMSIVFLSFYYNIYRYYKNLSNSSSVPVIDDAFSLFKNRIYRITLKDLFKRIRILGKLTNERGGVAKFFFGPLALHVVSSPEDAYTVLSHCMEKVFAYSMIEPYVGRELIAAPVSVWKTNRRLINHAFKQSVLDGYIEVFNKQAERLAAAMAEKVNKEFNFSEIITKISLETVCQTMMGIDVNNKDVITDNYVKAINRVLHILVSRFTRPWLMIDFIFYWTSLKKEQEECLKLMWNLSDQLVKLRKSEHIKRLKNKEQKHERGNRIQNSLDILIENTVTEDNALLTDLQIRQIIDNLLTAGFDTTSAQLLILLINIGSHPDVQKKIYEEVISVMGDKDRLISKNDLSRFTYLEAVLKESIRLYPISPLVGRKSTTNVQLSNYILPAGCNILVHLWAVNRNKNYWGPDADDFRPERWFDDSVPSHPAAFASFSLGRRNCIGKSYGMSFMKIVVANIVRKFTISADEKKLELEYAVLLKPTGGNLMKIKPR